MTKETKQQLIQRLQHTADAYMKAVSTSEADALEFRRDQYGLTEAEFAQILGIQLSQYSETIHGQRRLSVKSVVRAIAIGVLPEPLLFGRIKACTRPVMTCAFLPINSDVQEVAT